MHLFFRFRIFAFLIILALSIGITVSSLRAQYFGRNKVQYEKFNFKVLKTEHFDIYFYPEEREAVEQAARLAERWYTRLSRILNHNLKGRQPLILYSSSPHFQQTTTIPGIIGEGIGGVTEMFKRRVVLPFGASLAETDHVIGHELVHVFQLDITSQKRSTRASASPSILRLPLWFVEGLAEYLSIGPVDPHTAMWMRDAARRAKLPHIKKLENTRYSPYRYGHSLWSYITGRWGDDTVATIMKAAGKIGDYKAAFKKVLGISIEHLSKDWHEALKNSYDPFIQMTKVTNDSSRILIKGSKEKRLNISPSLSPNGKEIMFLSSRDLFSIDMFLAEARTGKIKRKIVETAVNPHFESLQFIRSSGSWNSEGTRFVFGAVSKGKPVLSLLNVKKGKVEREIVFPELGEILNPTWSPDGRYIAFSALAGGLTDLFIYDLKTDKVKRMTKDSFADLHPAWSPDGHSIAFVTDRFSTNLSILSIGNYEIALMDPESGEIQQISAFRKTKNINPQWSPDSKSLYFLSDQNGISNIYRIDLQSKKIFQVTNLYTGVSGITALSPALSVAQDTGRLTYCAYDEGNNTIYSIESSEPLLGNPALTHFGQANPSVLPPRKKAEGMLLGLLKNPLFGLPEETKFEVSDYKSKLSLDYVSTPSVAVGVDRYGTYAGGGMTLFWSDMMGYHTVATMAIVNSRLIDSAALIGYQNVKSRWNWGAVAQRIPYVTGYYSLSLNEVLGEPAIIEQELLSRQINYELAGFASYPFNQMQRFELTAGYRYIDFDRTVYVRAFSMIDDTLILKYKENLESPPGIHLGYASAALVYDSSFFGATSPIIGQSYRFEYSPVMGSLSFHSVLADYRRYFMPLKPFTLAFRFLHFGRYGKGGEDSRIWPLFIGYESLIRGYNYSSILSSEYNGGDDHFNFDQLFGSKIIIANIELRFPLFRVFGLGKGYYGLLPIEFNAFYDVGLAWWDDDKAWFLGGERKPLSSAGVGLRMNVMGYLILGIHYVRPFSRPNKGWYFQFTIMPGF